MSPDLLELTQNYFIGNTVRQVSTACDEDERRIGQALRSVLPLVLGVLLARTRQPGGIADLFARVYRVNRLNPLSNFGNLLGDVSAAAGPTPVLDGSLPSPSPGLLQTVLGPDYDGTVAAIGQQAGVAPDTVRKLLALAGAVALGLLGRHALQHTLDARGLASYLATQQAPIVSALHQLPAGVSQALAHLAGGAAVGAASLTLPTTPPASVPLAPPVAAPVVAPAPVPQPAPVPGPESIVLPPPAPQPAALPSAVSPTPAPEPVRRPTAPRRATPSRWPWLLVVVLVVVLAIAATQVYLLRNTTKPSPAQVAPPADSSAVTTAAANRLAYIAGRATLPLVSGAPLRVSNNSAEARLYHFLQDPAQAVSLDQTRGWLLLDQVYFAPGTATLTRKSGVQLQNLVAILQVFPHAALKLGGYTNDQRSADNNLLISADCANAARRALLRLGVAPGRLAAEGYGQAPTRTGPPAGRPQSRRVYLRVSKKY